MKKRYVAKIIVLVVALVMLVSILVACGEQNAPALQSAQYDSQGNLIVTLTDGTVLDPIDVNSLHTYGEWRAFGDFYPTCEEKVFYRSCSQCGDVEFKLGSYDDHDFVIETTKATCQVEGKEQRKCTICGKEEEKVLPKVDHEWESVYQFDTTYHWKKCINCTATTTKVEHVVDDSGYCTTCNGILGDTVGVIYDLSTDGTYAEVMGYEGSAKRVIIASEYNGKPVKSIYEEAFKKLAITSITIPDSVTSIGDEAFRSCDSLTSVTIGNSVTSIGSNAFYHCDSLTSVTIGNSVTSIGYQAFYNCTSLSSVNYLGTIEQWCGITFDGYHANPLYYAQKLYLNGELVEDLVIPSTVTEIKDYVFRGCTSIKSVTIPDSVTSIGVDAFYSCDSLSSVTIGNSVTSIGYQAFRYCSSLSSVTIGNSVTSIGSFAFYDCDSLSSVTIGNSVTSIGTFAFDDCGSLSTVYYNGTKEEWSGISIGRWNDDLTGAKRYYYSETEPTTSGNYWHYGDEGVPTPW